MEGKAPELNEDLIILGLKAKNWQEVLTKMSENLYKHSFVKESFTSAIIDREKVYSTGLQSSEIGVAIPHTDPEHVNIQSMSVAVLEEPVSFTHMGTDDLKVEVEIVFMLAMKDIDGQVKMLPRLMELFQKEDVLESIKTSKNKETIIQLVVNEIKTEE